jgi:hypothetical protein
MGGAPLCAWQPQLEYPLPRLTQNPLRHQRLRHLNFFQHECYSRSAGTTGQAAGRQGGAGRARLGRQARRLYLAVRGAGLDARQANAICGGGAHDRRKLASGACHLQPLCRSRPRRGRPVGASQASPSTRRLIGEATAISRWWPMPMRARSCSSAKAAGPTTSPQPASACRRPSLKARPTTAKGHDYLRQVPCGRSYEPSRGPDAAHRAESPGNVTVIQGMERSAAIQMVLVGAAPRHFELLCDSVMPVACAPQHSAA